jgi:Ino eighty subunit 2
METINKLLKKQAPKTNSRRRDIIAISAADVTPDGEPQKPKAAFVRWVSNRDGSRIGVPEELVDGPVGAVFVGRMKSSPLIEEVQ